MVSGIPQRNYDMHDVDDILNRLFRHSDSVIQRAGINRSLDERSEIPNCFVNDFGTHDEAVKALCSFVKELDISKTEHARSKLLNFLRISNDGSDIFQLP